MKKTLSFALFGILLSAIISCEKTEIKRESKNQSNTQLLNSNHNLKFKKVLKIEAGRNCTGYVNLFVSSNNQKHLNDYCEQFTKSLLDVVPSEINNQSLVLNDDNMNYDSTNVISIHMDMDNFKYNTEKKGIHRFSFRKLDNSKTYSFTYNNISNVTFSIPVHVVSVYSLYKKPWYTGSGRHLSAAPWTFSFIGNGKPYYTTSPKLNYQQNMDVQTFWAGVSGVFPFAGNTTTTINGFVYNLAYRARYDYVGPSLGNAYMTNGIISAKGYNGDYLEWCPATMTVYVYE